jgi:ABC-2 type transport system permease protein
MNAVNVILKRELASYFATPVAYIFIIIFLMLSGVFTFYLGQFFERGQADLTSFFNFIPWLYIVLVPAVSMRLWSEERRSGTIELIMTLPLSTFQVVIGKFLAAWLFIGLALILTFPQWLTVNYLGDPDNGVILAGYIGAWFMSGGFLAIGSCLSAATKNQIVAFILTLVVCFVLVVSGFPIVQDVFSSWAPLWLVDAVSNVSFLSHFNAISRGVIDLRDFVYFAVMIVAFLYATALVVDMKKAD